MLLTIDEAASRLGKSARQIRYMIKTGSLAAEKTAGRWFIRSEDLSFSEPQQKARQRKERQLRSAVEAGLGLDDEPKPPRYSVKDIKAVQLILPICDSAKAALGDEHPATRALRRSLRNLCIGCHRFKHSDKAEAYRAARDDASQAVYELLLDDQQSTTALIGQIEQELMAALSGLLRRLERRRAA